MSTISFKRALEEAIDDLDGIAASTRDEKITELVTNFKAEIKQLNRQPDARLHQLRAALQCFKEIKKHRDDYEAVCDAAIHRIERSLLAPWLVRLVARIKELHSSIHEKRIELYVQRVN